MLIYFINLLFNWYGVTKNLHTWNADDHNEEKDCMWKEDSLLGGKSCRSCVKWSLRKKKKNQSTITTWELKTWLIIYLFETPNNLKATLHNAEY